MAPDALDAGNVPHFLRVQVGLSDQMILHVTKQKAVLAFRIDKVAQALSVIELSTAEVTFNVTDRACADLLYELIRVGVDDEVAVVRGVSDDEELGNPFVWKLGFAFSGTNSDNFARVTHVLAEGRDRFSSNLAGRL